MESIYNNQQALKTSTKVLPVQNSIRLIAVGASAGGIETLKEFLLNLPEQLTNIAILIGFPIDNSNKKYLSAAINSSDSIVLKLAKQGEEIQAGVVYYSEHGYELDINGTRLGVNITAADVQSNQVNKLFESLSYAAGEKSIAIVLSGMGSDGAKGIKKIKEAGGYVIVQAPPTAMYNAMPVAAINTGCADLVIPPFQMGNAIWDAVQLQKEPAGEYALQNEPDSKQTMQKTTIGFKTNEVISSSIPGFLPGALYCNENIAAVDSMVKETIFNCYQHTYLIVNSSFIIQEVKGDTSLFIKGLTDLTNQHLLTVTNEELKAVVITVTTKATTMQQVVKSNVQMVELYSDLYFVRIIVKPILTAGKEAFYLIIFENLQGEKVAAKGIQKTEKSWM